MSFISPSAADYKKVTRRENAGDEQIQVLNVRVYTARAQTLSLDLETLFQKKISMTSLTNF